MSWDLKAILVDRGFWEMEFDSELSVTPCRIPGLNSQPSLTRFRLNNSFWPSYLCISQPVCSSADAPLGQIKKNHVQPFFTPGWIFVSYLNGGQKVRAIKTHRDWINCHPNSFFPRDITLTNRETSKEKCCCRDSDINIINFLLLHLFRISFHLDRTFY